MQRPYRLRPEGGWEHVDGSEQPDADYLPRTTELPAGIIERRYSSPATHTRQDAEQYVARCLGEHAEQHDVPTITDALYDLAGTWDVRQVDAEDFWPIVRAHALDSAGQEASAPRDGERAQVFNPEQLTNSSAPRDPDSACPSWCAAHESDEPGITTHRRTITIGLATVEVEQVTGTTPGPDDPIGAYIVLDDVQWINGQDAHDFAGALTIAAQLVHPLGGLR